MGSTTLTLWNTDAEPVKRRVFTGFFSREAASPFKLMFVATLVHLLMAVQGCFRDGGFAPVQFVPLWRGANHGLGALHLLHEDSAPGQLRD